VETRGKDKAGDVKDQVKSKVEDFKGQAENVWSDLGDKLDETLTAALHRLGVPTREEIHSLTKKIDALNAKIEHLKPAPSPAPAHKASHVAS
jgi:poly(hydroxyalkanoate) granule-associated protein